jgi:hypothetical protein
MKKNCVDVKTKVKKFTTVKNTKCICHKKNFINVKEVLFSVYVRYPDQKLFGEYEGHSFLSAGTYFYRCL